MAASFLGSFIIFIGTGIYVLHRYGLRFAEDPFIRIFVFVVLLANACFYYYFAAYTEMDAKMRESLKNCNITEWIIRVINQSLLFSLWFWLQFGWWHFAVALLLIYITYLIWDWVTRRAFKKHFLFWLDLAGFGVTILFLIFGSIISSKKDGPRAYFFWGITSILYLVIAGEGVRRCKFYPFAKEFRSRPKLH